SADRAGAHCAKDLQSVARALFKLASGLSGKTISFSLEDFLNQVDEMQLSDAEPGQGAPKEDWFSTHPFSPLRVKALSLFDESILARDNGKDKETLEVEVQSLMSLMEPSYLEGRTKTSEAMRRALFAAAMAVAAADGTISDSEKKVFEQFFGSGTLTDSLSVDKLREELPGRLALVKELASIPQRMQLLRDLCLIASAEDQTGPLERAVLDEVADALDVPRGFICKNLDRDMELD
ncbi:MAG: TerB family tellurite resistance protein, partial [Pseudomonadota bacterium]